MNEVLEWFAGISEAGGYAVLTLSACVEYIFPPFPGDTISLAGAALAASAGYAWWLTWAALTFGATVGGAFAWAFGRVLRGNEARWPRALREARARERLARLERLYAKHGAVVLAANRFVPVLRSLFFVGAGLSNVGLAPVLLWGSLSAALWNGLLIAAGFALGSNAERLEAMFLRYRNVALVVATTLFALWALRALWARARDNGNA